AGGGYATFEHDGTAWRARQTSVSPVSAGKLSTAVDGARGRVVAVGFAGLLPGGTFEWTGTDWVAAASPPTPSGSALATDPVTQHVLLFGGFGAAGAVSDLWDWNGIAWTRRQPATSPPPRSNHAMATDLANGRVVLFGGVNRAQVLGDTWLF